MPRLSDCLWPCSVDVYIQLCTISIHSIDVSAVVISKLSVKVQALPKNIDSETVVRKTFAKMKQLHLSTNSYNTSNAGTNYFDSKDDGDRETNDWSSFADSDLVLALYGIICVLGITGNLLVAIVLIRVPSLRSNTSDFLIHLSLVDFIVCVLVIPFKLVPTTGKSLPNPGFFGELRCRLYVSQFIFWVCVLASVLGLVTVNLERFVAIVYPHRYKTVFTRRNKYMMIASCWILGVLSKSFIFSLYSEDEAVGCRFLGWPSRGVQVVVALYTFTIQLFAPFVVMVLAQWKVISTLKRQVKMLTDRTGKSHFWVLRLLFTTIAPSLAGSSNSKIILQIGLTFHFLISPSFS